MKKLVLAGMFMAFFAPMSIAQISNGLHFGIKAGTNLSNVYDSQTSQFNADNKLGIVAGGFVSIPFGKFVGIQPEVLFSQKGFKGSGTLLGSNYSFKRTTSYLDVPILLAIKPFDFLTVLAGPQYSFLLKQKDEFDNSIISGQQEQVFQTDNLRKNMLGVLGGIDFNLKTLVVGLRAGWDLQNNNGDGTTTTPRYKNAWYQATIGFRIF